jgi:DNA-binding IclR family transcriptional regulator
VGKQNQGLSLTVTKAMDILDCLGQAREPLAASEIGRRLGIPRSTAYRLLATLAAGRYVAQDVESPEKFRLGFKIVELAGSLLDTIELRQEAAPFLRELRDLANETVHLVVMERGQVAYVDKLECLQAVRMHSSIGRQGFAHSTAVGKAMIAFLPEDAVASIVAEHGLPALTANTITDLGALAEELDQVRRQGYAIDDLENEEGIRCVGAPIFDHTDKPVAAVSVSGPAYRMTLERTGELSVVVRRKAGEISRRLGHQGQRHRDRTRESETGRAA